MNLPLKREIIKHIFEILGIFEPQNTQIRIMDKLTQDKFIIDKKIAFEIDDKKYKHNIWASTTTIGEAVIKIMIADIRENVSEYAMIIQMDTFPPCAMALSTDVDDFGAIYFGVENNNWANANTLLQAKILVGIEEITEVAFEWHSMKDYSDMYKYMIGFLNFLEQTLDEE